MHKINFLVPLSELFSSKTASPVVPDPAKKSSIMLSFFPHKYIKSLINSTGLGLSNKPAPTISLSLFVPLPLLYLALYRNDFGFFGW